MTNTEIHSQPQLIEARKLEKSPLNVRRTVARSGIDELKASILAHGLMQNLVVTEDDAGTFLVIAGGRRLQAIHSLQAEGKLPQEFVVPCQVVADASALEMSLAENIVRLAMHPADQFEAFAELIEQGHTAAEVAVRFGVEESLVHKRMKLARVSPKLFQLYREDEMTLECLMAFTVTDDHRRQLKVYKSLSDWQKDDPSTIRDALTEKMVEASSKLARFVGLEAYTAAGAPTRADLFGEEIYLEKPALLNKLAEQKVVDIRHDLEAEGWGWIEFQLDRDYTLIHQCTRLRPQLMDAPSDLLDAKSRLDAELEEIEQMLEDTESDESLDRQQEIQDQLDEVAGKLAAFVGFDAEQKRLAGCFVSLGQDGTPFFDKGLVKPEHRKQLARLTEESDSTPSQKAKIKHPLSTSLRRDLAAARLQAAQVELSKQPAVAFDLLVFQVASGLLGDTNCVAEGADIRFQIPRTDHSQDLEPTIANNALFALANAFPLEWLRLDSEADRFEAFRSLPDTAKQELLAYCVAMTLKPKLAPTAEEEVTAYDVALSLTSGDVANYWRPTSENFLKRITRDQLLAIGRDAFGANWAQSRAGDKKASLVGQLHRVFSNPEKLGLAPEQIERLKRWLPAGMSFEIATKPESAEISIAA